MFKWKGSRTKKDIHSYPNANEKAVRTGCGSAGLHKTSKYLKKYVYHDIIFVHIQLEVWQVYISERQDPSKSGKRGRFLSMR